MNGSPTHRPLADDLSAHTALLFSLFPALKLHLKKLNKQTNKQKTLEKSC